MIEEMLETNTATAYKAKDKKDKKDKKEKDKDPGPYCCTPPDIDPGPGTKP